MLHAKFPQPLPDPGVEIAAGVICLYSKSAWQNWHVAGKLDSWRLPVPERSHHVNA
jgi:hypothetical protein